MKSFLLRRAGTEATLSRVQDVMRLAKDVTTLGRHSGNVYYLDSTKLTNYISRWHAEIHRVATDTDPQFLIRDNSLNGTYVNHHRVKGNVTLHPGDIIHFGHKNGKHVKPGEKAPQRKTEFCFIFEEVSESAPVSYGSSVPMVDLESEPSSPTIPMVAMESASLGSQGTPGVIPPDPQPVSRCLLPSPTEGTTFILKDISNKTEKNQLLRLDDLISSHGHRTCDPVVSEEDASVYQQAIRSAQSFQPDSEPDQVPIATSAITTTACGFSSVLATPATADTPSHSSPPTPADHFSPSRPPGPSRKTTTHKPGKRLSTPGGGQPSKRGRPSGRGRGSSRSSPRDVDSDSDDDYTWHYDGDRCDAFDCKQPTCKTVSWVQCDDCDKWYHTTCAGCNYSKVKNDTAEFHCGCV